MQASQKTSQQELFEKVFGEKAFIDPAIVSRLKNHPEERIKLDLDGDGKIDTIYFIDHDPRRQQEFRPLLVKAIDRDGDMERDGAADLDSDLYIADWHADGVVDSVVEYRDTDRDNVGEKIAHSRGGRRYYLDMIRERYFYRITRAMAKQPELLRQIE
ncbi:MAG: hypothetical protein J2P41_22655, partial [Blastocatellia bacterium]|nr:hypothetical protein [Blastocatellia bacterium]